MKFCSHAGEKGLPKKRETSGQGVGKDRGDVDRASKFVTGSEIVCSPDSEEIGLRSSDSMEGWRKYFEKAEGDIWTVIDKAISVAQSDCPGEFRQRRDGIAERLFAPSLELLSSDGGSNKVTVTSGEHSRYVETVDEGTDDMRMMLTRRPVKIGSSEEVDDKVDKVNHEMDYEDDDILRYARDTKADEDEDAEDYENDHDEEDEKERFDDGEKEDDEEVEEDDEDEEGEGEGEEDEEINEDEEGEYNGVVKSVVDDDSVEALNDEIEDERLQVKEIHSIKNSFYPFMPEKEALGLFERLKWLNISVDLLKSTDIGRFLHDYRHQHTSEKVHRARKALVNGWKSVVEEIMESSSKIALQTSGTDGSGDNSVQGEHDVDVGLASPPLDEIAMLAVRGENYEMSKILDFTDDELSAASGPTNLSPGIHPRVIRSVDKIRPEDARSQDRNNSGPPRPEARVLKLDKNRPQHVQSKSETRPRLAAPDSRPRVVGTDATPRVVGPDAKPRAAGPDARPRAAGPDARPRAAGPDARPRAAGPDARPRAAGPDARPRAAGPASASASATIGAGSGSGHSNVLSRSSSGRPAAGSGSGLQKQNKGQGGVKNTIEPPNSKGEEFKPGLATKSRVIMDDEQVYLLHKRRVRQNYDIAAQAKRQRTVQPIDLTDLPKGGPKAQKLPQPKNQRLRR